jgi:hypothetical protein
MTCKDCISYEVCENGQWYETPCVHFKNKADFVKVVRCKDCKYGEVDDTDFPNQYLCNHSGCDWNEGKHFCSYGERNDNEPQKINHDSLCETETYKVGD